MSASEENLESFKGRATDLLSQLPSLKLSPFALARLSKLVIAELRFLHRHPCPPLHSTNLGYLEAVVQIVQHPHVDAVSALFHTFKRRSSSLTDVGEGEKAVEAHVDIICTFHSKPVWIIVSDRNPNYAYWSENCDNSKGWRSRVQLLVDVAQSLRELRPSAVLFCFARGVSSSLLIGFQRDVGASQVRLSQDPSQSCRAVEGLEFGGSSLVERDDGDWVCIYKSEEVADLDTFSQSLQQSRTSSTLNASRKHWITFQVDISAPSEGCHPLHCGDFNTKKPLLLKEPFVKSSGINVNSHEDTSNAYSPQPSSHSRSEACSDGFLSCLSMLKQPVSLAAGKDQDHLQTTNLVNLDTTVLIALVSEVSNGAAPTLVNMCLEELVLKFKSTAQFMRDQAEEELKGPLLAELTEIFKCRRAFMSESVCKEFKSLVSLCGSVNEKTRAEELLRVIPVVPDAPSSRVTSLGETGTIKRKNKVIFGTGDSWQAPTLTANLSFVRAVRQTGMALSTLEHKPRALVGAKCG